MEERTLLITGATGFVGTHLIAFCHVHFPRWKLFFLVRQGIEVQTMSSEASVKMDDLAHFLNQHNGVEIIHLAGKAHDTAKTTEPNTYYKANLELTKVLFDQFLKSNAKSFLFISTIKSIHHKSLVVSDETHVEELITPYAISKRMAEDYILAQKIPEGKRFFILRPALVYGKGVKGNLRSLVKFAKTGLPYPFYAFKNKRSYISVTNLCFVITELIRSNAPSDVFNVADDEPLGTAEIVHLLGKSVGKSVPMWSIPVYFWKILAIMGDFLRLPFNSEVLAKLTESMVVSNSHLLTVIQKPLPEKSHSAIGNIV